MAPGRNDPCTCGSGKKYKRCCGGLAAPSHGSSPSVEQLVESGMQLHQAGQLERAEALYRQALSRRPRDAGIFNLLGILGIHRNDGKEAVSWLEMAVKQDPRDPQYRNNLAAAKKAAGDMEGAIAALRSLVERHPAYDEGWYNLGNALEERKEFEASEQAYGRALSLRPGDPDSLYGLGRVLMQKNERLSEAEKCFRKSIEARPRHAKSWNRLGLVLQGLERLDEAEAAFCKAMEIDPSFVQGINGLGGVLMQRGRHHEAILLFEQAMTIDPDEEHAYFGLAQCKKFSGEDRPLLEKIEYHLGGTKDDEEKLIGVHYALGKIYDDLGEFEEAFKHYQQANDIQRRLIPFDREKLLELHERLLRIYEPRLFSHGLAGSNSDRPIFIVGMPRSGTTLTEQIIASHPAVYGAGELPFWPEHVATMPTDFPAAWDVEQSRGLAAKYLEVIARGAGDARYVTDKLPGNYQNLGLIHLVLPHARIIHCRRNPVDTCLSIYFQNFVQGHEYRFDLESLAFMYREYQRLMAHWRNVLPPDIFIEVDYEEMVRNQEGVSRRLIEFCGLEWDARCLEFYKNERAVKTASQWQVRQPIYKTSQERWRNYKQWIEPLLELVEGS